MLRRHINSQLGSQVDQQWRDEQGRISADFRIWLSQEEDSEAGEGEIENFKDAREAWAAVDDALVPGSGATRKQIMGLVSKARGKALPLRDDESRQAFNDMTKKRLATEKTLDESLQWVSFARDFDTSMGESPFTVFLSMMQGASQNGHAQQFGHSWDNPKLIAQRVILGNLMAAAQQEFGEDISYRELMERTHNRIVRGNNMVEEWLTPDVDGEKVSQNNQYEAAKEHLSTFPKATTQRFIGNPILGTLMSSGESLIEGWGSVAQLQNVADFAMNNAKSSGKAYPLMGKAITGLFAEHNSVGHVDDGGDLGVPRGAFGLARIIDNHGIDYADITDMSMPEVMEKYPDAGRDIFFWLNSETVRTGAQLPGQRGYSTFSTRIGRGLDAIGIPGNEGSVSRMTFREALRADDKAAGAYLPSKASARVIERRKEKRADNELGMSMSPDDSMMPDLPPEEMGGAPEEGMPLAPEEEMAGAGEMPPDAQAGPPLPPGDDPRAVGVEADAVEIPVIGPWSKVPVSDALKTGTRLGKIADDMKDRVEIAEEVMQRLDEGGMDQGAVRERIAAMVANISKLEERAMSYKESDPKGGRSGVSPKTMGALKRLTAAKNAFDKDPDVARLTKGYWEGEDPAGRMLSNRKTSQEFAGAQRSRTEARAKEREPIERAKAKAGALGEKIKSKMRMIEGILEDQKAQQELEKIAKVKLERAALVGVIAQALEDPRGAVARAMLAIATGKSYGSKERVALVRALNDKASKDRRAARADKGAQEMNEKLRDKEMDRKAKAKSEWMKKKARQHGGRRH
jgi:hypothetical protein